MNTQTMPTISLYEQDHYLWLETTAKLLREGNFSQVDMEELIEEIEDMAKDKKRELQSRLILILMHLLKWVYQPQMRTYYGNSWISTIVVQRNDLILLLEDSPSLKRFLPEVFNKCYQKARKSAAKETGLDIDSFPVDSPFSIEQTLDSDYIPD